MEKDAALVVWDFDWTIANCNSDEYVPAYFLGVDAVKKRFDELYSAGVDWHCCVEEQMKDAANGYAEKDYRDAVRTAAACMPYLEDVRRVVEGISSISSKEKEKHGDDGLKLVEQVIVSDGNEIFIRSFLEGNGMLPLFSAGIVSNSASFISAPAETESPPSIKVVPCFGTATSTFPQSHQCPTCPSNLCKSHVLRHLLSTTYAGCTRPRIIYVGDGSNDACPALHVLQQGDILFARTGYAPDADPQQRKGKQSDDSYCEKSQSTNFVHTQPPRFRIIPKLDAAKAEGTTIKPDVYCWNSGKELHELVNKHVLHKYM